MGVGYGEGGARDFLECIRHRFLSTAHRDICTAVTDRIEDFFSCSSAAPQSDGSLVERGVSSENPFRGRCCHGLLRACEKRNDVYLQWNDFEQFHIMHFHE